MIEGSICQCNKVWQSYTPEEWLDALQTSGGVIPESQLADRMEGVGDAIDAVGGSFTMNYLTFVVTALRRFWSAF